MSDDKPTRSPAELLLMAAIACPHVIEEKRIVLDFDGAKPGNNTLNQLSLRLKAVLTAIHAQPRACACGEPGAAGVVHRTDGPCHLADQSTAEGDVENGSVFAEAAALFLKIDALLKPHGWPAQKMLRDYVELVKRAIAAANVQPKGTPSDAQILAAARALNKQCCDECGTDEEDSWKLYGNSYIIDAGLALRAAIGVTAPPSPEPVAEVSDWCAPNSHSNEPENEVFWLKRERLPVGTKLYAKAPAPAPEPTRVLLVDGVPRDATEAHSQFGVCWGRTTRGEIFIEKRLDAPVATLHDDGCFTWKRDEFRLRYDRQHAGWRMDVYARPGPSPAVEAEDDMLEPLIYAAIMHNGTPKTAAEFERAARTVAEMLERRTPASGEWRGLTGEERAAFVNEICDHGTGFVAPLFSLAESLEDVLRARNSASPAAPAQAEADAKDATRYQALRGTLGVNSFTYAPRITDPSNEWLTYTPDGLDKVCDEMAAALAAKKPASRPPVQDKEGAR